MPVSTSLTVSVYKLLHISTSPSLEVFTCLDQSQVTLSSSLLQSLPVPKGHCVSPAVTIFLYQSRQVTVSL